MGRPCKCCGKIIVDPSEPCGACPCYDQDNSDIYDWLLVVCLSPETNDNWDIYIGKTGDPQEDLGFVGSVDGEIKEDQECRCFIFATNEDMYRENGNDIVFEVSEQCNNANFCSVNENINIVSPDLFDLCESALTGNFLYNWPKIRFVRSQNNNNGSLISIELWRRGPLEYLDENEEVQTKIGYCLLAYEIVGVPNIPGVNNSVFERTIYQSCCPIYCQEKVCSCYNFDDPNFEDPDADPDCVGRYPVKVKDFYAEASEFTDSISAVWHTESQFSLDNSTFMAHSEFTINGMSALNRRLDLVVPVSRTLQQKYGIFQSNFDNCLDWWKDYIYENFEQVMYECAPEFNENYDFCSDPGCLLWLLSSPVPINGQFIYRVFSRQGDIIANREWVYDIQGYADYGIANLNIVPTGAGFVYTGSDYPKSKEFSINNNSDPSAPIYGPANMAFKLIFNSGFIEDNNGLRNLVAGPYDDHVVTMSLSTCKYPDPFGINCKCSMKDRVQQSVDVGVINFHEVYPSWWYRGDLIFSYAGGTGGGLPLIESLRGCVYDYSTIASTVQYDCKKMANLESSVECPASSISYDTFFGENYYSSTGYGSRFKLFRTLE